MIFDAHTVDIEVSAGDDKLLYTLLYSTTLSYIHNCVKRKSTLKSTNIKSDWGRGRYKTPFIQPTPDEEKMPIVRRIRSFPISNASSQSV